MSLKLKRIIIFTNKMSEITAFYGDQLGLPPQIDPEYDAKEWIEFDAGGAKIALHQAHGRGKGGGCAHKIVFYERTLPRPARR